MNVFVQTESKELVPLKHHLALEGVKLVKDEKEANLVIAETHAGIADNRFVYSHVKFPHAILKALNLSVVFSKTRYFVTKWYDYKKGWGEQTFLGIPVHGVMTGGLGKPETVSVCGRYIKGNQVPDIFSGDFLKSFLNDLSCRSFVTVEFSADNEICGIQTGVPYGGLYNLLEGVKGSLLEFFLDPFKNRLIESWTTNVQLSRYPWPFETRGDKISIHGVVPEVEAHVWFYNVERFRRSIVSTESLVARVTAWGETLVESNRRVLRTAFDLDIPMKQFRLDSSRVAGDVYEGLLSSGVV